MGATTDRATGAPVAAIGWREEHTRLQRLILWLQRRPHCCDL